MHTKTDRNAPDGKSLKKMSVNERIIALVSYISRIAVGITFIYSGFVKAVDPWGTIYKFQEYITAMHAPWLLSQATAGAFLLFGFEFVIGVVLITGSYRKWAPRLSLLFMSIMLPLTLWIAIAEPVADCGCFGDAMHLSNWATFQKNIPLTAMCIWLWKYNSRIRCIIIPTLQVISMCVSIAFIAFIGFIGYNVQPLEDYRPYPEGSTLLADDASADITEYKAVWADGTHTITIAADSIPPGDSWTFKQRINVSPQSSETQTKALAIYDGDEDVTEDVIVSDGKQVILFFPSLKDVSIANYYKLNSLYAFAEKNDIDMLAVAAGDSLQIAGFIDLSLAEYPVYTAEDTAIKEVVRGNPGIIYMEDGKIVWKYAFASVPTDDFMNGDTTDLLQYKRDDKTFLRNLWIAYAAVILLLILLSHIPMFMRRLSKGLRSSAHITHVLIISLIFGLTLTSCGDTDKPDEPVKSDQLTVLIYMVASNNLYNNSIIDLEELKAGVEATDPSKINVLVYYVQPAQAPQLIHIKNNGELPATTHVVRTYPYNNESLTAPRISQVINDVVSYAPADDYGLFLWSHATNWLPATRTASPQYSFGNDQGIEMDITTLSQAVPSDMFSFIWMDCCLMGSLETAYQFRDKCDTYISYPTEVLGTGAPYNHVIPALCNGVGNPLVEAARLTFSYYADNTDPNMRHCTISVLDTSRLPNIVDACRHITDNDTGDISLIGLQSYGRKQSVSFYDALQCFARMTGDNPNAISDLRSCFTDAVIYKAATPSMLGITIDPQHFSGLSTTLLQTLITPNQQNLYHELDWYNAIYAH